MLFTGTALLTTYHLLLTHPMQDPVLFTGSLRHNLDPFDENSDAQLRTALERCGLLATLPLTLTLTLTPTLTPTPTLTLTLTLTLTQTLTL